MGRALWPVLLAVGCNQVFDLEPTVIPPGGGPLDLDADGVLDKQDNCLGATNADQSDNDDDGFGDACDLCPQLATTTNHDEDGDLRGDDCDSCPVDADFAGDQDRDEVGDACDNDFATDNNLVLFDSFLALGADWQPASEPWVAMADAVGTSAASARLRHATATLAAARPWWLRIGITSREPWNGDTFGFELVDGDVVRVACTVVCTAATCKLDLVPMPFDLPSMVTATPVAAFQFNRSMFGVACNFAGANANEDLTEGTGDLQLVLVGSPRVQFRYVALWQ
jgi:hypothetical protein